MNTPPQPDPAPPPAAADPPLKVVQWWSNGDHPRDHADGRPSDWEGAVVRYYRSPDVSGRAVHDVCGRIFHDHGWIDHGPHGHCVCPGDVIVELGAAGFAVIKPADLVEPARARTAESVFASQLGWVHTELEHAVNGRPDAVRKTLPDTDSLYCLTYRLAQQAAALIHGGSLPGNGPAPGVLDRYPLVDVDGVKAFLCRRCPGDGHIGVTATDIALNEAGGMVVDQAGVTLADVVEQALNHEREHHSAVPHPAAALDDMMRRALPVGDVAALVRMIHPDWDDAQVQAEAALIRDAGGAAARGQS